MAWVEVCEASSLDKESVIRFDHAGRTFAIYRSLDEKKEQPEAVG